MFKLAASIVTAAAAMCVAFAPTAAATPSGTQEIILSMAACEGGASPEINAQCAAAMTQQWLTPRGKSHVVQRTLAVQEGSFGAWFSPETGSICGFAEVAQLMRMGAHQCGATTFFSYVTDGYFLESRNATIAVFIHESFHGEEEDAGYPVVRVNLANETREIYKYEQASDCAAGAGFRWLVSQGLRTEADFAEAREFMAGMKHSESHGGGEERGSAFDLGAAGGVAVCYKIAAGQLAVH